VRERCRQLSHAADAIQTRKAPPQADGTCVHLDVSSAALQRNALAVSGTKRKQQNHQILNPHDTLLLHSLNTYELSGNRNYRRKTAVNLYLQIT
jgi:hypothetical protein